MFAYQNIHSNVIFSILFYGVPLPVSLYIDRESCSSSKACVITCDVTGTETEEDAARATDE